ncbi:CD300a molecule [Homo sapiens]|uniref:CMRF35-like molecule 8 n=2 Tax=Homo sapiens TaxID=9606 RepID=CLM8_HUMAN|nr:CMRF35-like molecule 8 isoform 1 precursor [Homo sapiens]Q9UGN4.2 RecName: Full=CMRF35-like molecule 8; Short=CLM-8; AltName: Full=CD300 antigen-like family member A; AltName: Full=CMRF-35-H9; Short=CMRF35-H9; AltName: Full=CMRF35-H; AltName: Full=IRC1/IRC2; AltName: Full=Immunoglobulin superfamily member 12; Short=IgSF12; AltName: Full=Inhibitory receptor protein 60; Short=IRp60; AltName: Full=NK inhibitory receptor; AltName: CD_antigen=CD300a; Flags: Precursor [Homo sapiens]AAH32352.1 CD300a|eukprot:NP_009192.2 CMRF35-like molecule 8 isoform 1 precursor [Homo sapiens]
MWLPWALLLLWVPGCFALSKCRTVAGPVGGSLSVQCPYEKEHRTLNKYWCRPPQIFLCDKIVETKGSAGKRNGRVSIRDSPANLSFTVTLENLTEEDAGTYWCGVDTPWLRDFHDPVVEVEVSVFPASTSMTPASITAAKTSTITTAFPPVSSTTLFAVGATHSASIQEETEEVVNSQLPLLLSLLALLLLLLVGASLLAWRMFQKWIKAGDHSELSQNPKQAATQSELHYANLELLMWPLQEKPAPPREVEVEYSTVASPREELHYASVVFDSNTNRIAAQRPREEEPDSDYSVIRKT